MSIVLAKKDNKYKGKEYSEYVGVIRLDGDKRIILSISCDEDGGIRKYDLTDKRSGEVKQGIYVNATPYRQTESRKRNQMTW